MNKENIEILVTVEIEYTGDARQDAIDSAMRSIHIKNCGAGSKGFYFASCVGKRPIDSTTTDTTL